MGLVKPRFWIVWAACLLVAAALSGLPNRRDDILADIVFTTIKGEQIALRDLRGYPVLVTFWASDCRSCIEEMPRLSEIYRRYAQRGLKMFGVAMHYDPPSRVLATATARGIPYPIVLDLQAIYARAFDGVNMVPNSFLIAPSGELSMHRVGLMDFGELGQRIERMLQEV